jgi:hypothetical protein
MKMPTTGQTQLTISLWHEVKGMTSKPQTMFNNCLLYLCRARNCQDFLRQAKHLGVDAGDWRVSTLLQWRYYVTLRLYTFSLLSKKPVNTVFNVAKGDAKAVLRALKRPSVMRALTTRFAAQKNIAYSESEVSEHINETLPTLKRASRVIVRSKLKYLTVFNGLLYEDLEQDLLMHAVQNLGWAYDRRPAQESVLLGCKIMHNKAANMANFHSAKKRACAGPRDANGFSAIRIIHDTDKAAATVNRIPDESSNIYVEQNRIDLERALVLLKKNKKRRRLLTILTQEQNPEFEKWLKTRKLLRGKQTDKHLFLRNPREFFLLAANHVGFSQKQTRRLLLSLSGERE